MLSTPSVSASTLRLLAALALLPVVGCECGDELAGVTGAVVGVVCGADGAPSADVTVRVEHAGGRAAARTDERGGFRVARVPAGESVLIIDPDGQAREHDLRVEGSTAAQFLDPACRDGARVPGTGSVTGLLCDRHVGDLVRDALVTVALPGGESVVTASDSEGAFAVHDLPVGEHVLTVQGEGYQRSWLVPVRDGETYDLDVGSGCTPPTGQAGWVGGQLCDPGGGGALAGATVTTTDALGDAHSDVTEVDGAFLLGPAAPGPVMLRVARPPDVDFTLAGHVYAGQQSTVLGEGGCVEETCSSSVITATEEEVSLFLVVDRSGSMDEPAVGYPGSRWNGVKTAIANLTNAVQDDVELGLMLYPERLSEDQCGAGEVAVAPALSSASMIQSALDSPTWEPEGGTPTAASLSVARSFLAGRSTDRRRAVVLATDGGPNCNAQLSGLSCTCSVSDDDYCRQGGQEGALNCLDNEAVTDEVSALYDEHGIPTYVIGIPGSENFGWVLDEMAVAGHTALAGATGYYDATDVGALEQALDEIGRRVAGCRLTVDDELYEASSVRLYLDDVEHPRDPARQSGFDVVGPNELELFGESCDAWLLTDVAARVASCAVNPA